jgi:hypothetical protein
MRKATQAGKFPFPPPAERVTKRALLAECKRLEALTEYDEDGFHFWPHVGGVECGLCTNGARLIAQKFGGFVAGYSIAPEDPRSLVGADVFGHDFAVVGNFIVDWWGWEYERSLESPVLSRAEGIALGKYKPERAWEVLPDDDFRSP